MTEIASVGLDIAKNWFQVHAADAEGRPVIRRKLRRDQVANFFAALPTTVVGIEACSTSHHWGRTIEAAGHRVRLLPPQYVRPFVKRSKTDSADAEAICEALRRAGIRDVPVKSREQQATLAVHRARDLLVRQRTMISNAIRGFAAEFGMVAPRGQWRIEELRQRLHEARDDELPATAREVIDTLFLQIAELERRIGQLEKRTMAWHRENDVSRRLATIPGVGPMNATLMAATIPDASQMRASSAPDVSLPPGSALCPASTPAAANSAWAGSRSEAILTCGAC